MYLLFNCMLCMEIVLIFSHDQVLPRENGVRYPWNFIFQGRFWKKKSIIEYHTSSLEVTINDNISKKKIGFSRKDALEPSVESISLDMRQQELDGRYIKYVLKFEWISVCTFKLIISCTFLFSAFLLYATLCSCTAHFGASPLTCHLFSSLLVDASKLGTCIRYMLQRRGIVVLLTHWS